MEFIQNIILEVPLWQMAILLVIMTICLAFGRYSLGLISAILFVIYWGYLYNFDKFFEQACRFNYFTLWFIIIAGMNVILVLVLSLYAFSMKD
jgi:hypothetical protein